MSTSKVEVQCRVCLGVDVAEVHTVHGQIFRRLPPGWLQKAGRGGERELVCNALCARLYVLPRRVAGTLCCPDLGSDVACPERENVLMVPRNALGTFSSVDD